MVPKKSVKEKKRPKTKTHDKGEASRLPPGVKRDDYGLYIMVPRPPHDENGNATQEKRMEVIMNPDPNLGRAIANRANAFYWDEALRIFLYRGLKVIGGGPELPKPDNLYTMTYPGYRPARTPPPTMEGGTGPGKVEQQYPYAKDELQVAAEGIEDENEEEVDNESEEG